MQHLRSNIRDGFIVALVVWSLLYGFDLYQVTRAFLNPAMTSPQTPKLLSESEIADQVSRDLPAPKSLLVPPAHPVSPDNPPTLIDLFNKDFPNLMRVSDNGFDLGSVDGEIIHIGVRVYLDFSGKNEFIGFYIPSSGKEFEACLALVGRVQPIITNLSKRHEAIGGDAGGVTSSRELTFSGRVFLYHEWPLSNKQKADVVEAYGAKGLDVQFRGLDYLADQVIAWHQEHDARTSH
jgi:hypothetical protein